MQRKIQTDWAITALFLGPALLLILFSTGVPILVAFRTSMYSTNYAKLVDFIGFKNFKLILFSIEGWQKIFNSVVYVVSSLVLVVPLGIGTAVLLNRKIKLVGLLRTIIIIPWILSQTVSALLWKWLLNANFGPVVYFLNLFIEQRIDFFNTPLIARIVVVIINVWNTFPIVLILTLAALQTIPQELYEAARVDGSNRYRSFIKITLPLIMPTVATVILLQSMEYFNMVTLIYVLTSGGPFGATETISVKAFKEGFDYWHMGVGSAYSVIIFLLNVLFSLLYIKLLKRKGDEG